MIAWLRGTIVAKGADAFVLDVGGVGYELFASLRTLDALPPVGAAATVHVQTLVREDAISLYGFHEPAAKRVFNELLGVGGVGPKLALSALSTFSVGELRQAVVGGDHKKLARISGVGAKTAQRIVLELTARLRAIDVDGTPISDGPAPAGDLFEDVRHALLGLGYAPKVVDATVDQVAAAAKPGASTEELVKDALALLRT